MLRFSEIVFGPIHSRRLGASLGVNLLPSDGKICNFDCIYCECGWNRDGVAHNTMPSLAEVAGALDKKLREIFEKGERVDSITFSGHGEPTLHPDFAAIVDETVRLRDLYCPSAKISVLSNATRLDDGRVFEALRKVNNPILKLDAPSTSLALSINRPNGAYSVERVIEGMKRFNGDFILQTMFLKGSEPDYENDRVALEAWMNIVREIKPRLTMVYTLDRPSPMTGLSKMNENTMGELLKPLFDEGYKIQING